MEPLDSKWEALLNRLKASQGVIVAYSGGVDSTFLAKAAYLALRENSVAVTGGSPTLSMRELKEAKALTKAIGIRHELVSTSEWDNPSYRKNDEKRCFYCKGTLFELLNQMKHELGLKRVVDGTNLDDLQDSRPGLEAASSFGVGHPLIEAGFTKQDIRQKSRELGLPTWNKGSFACLASRIPKGKRLKMETLKRVEKAEEALADLGFKQFRVRDFENLAKVEVGQDEIERFNHVGIRIRESLQSLGYRFVYLDPRGYRTPGSFSP